MHAELTEVAWIGEDERYSLAQFAELAGASEQLLRELIEWGAIAPLAGGGGHWLFAGATVTTVRIACRLGTDLELEPQGMALAVSLLGRIRRLEAQLAELRARQSP